MQCWRLNQGQSHTSQLALTWSLLSSPRSRGLNHPPGRTWPKDQMFCSTPFSPQTRGEAPAFLSPGNWYKLHTPLEQQTETQASWGHKEMWVSCHTGYSLIKLRQRHAQSYPAADHTESQSISAQSVRGQQVRKLITVFSLMHLDFNQVLPVHVLPIPHRDGFDRWLKETHSL